MDAWYGSVLNWFGSSLILVWVCFGSSWAFFDQDWIWTHFFSTFGDVGGVISSSDDELDDESLSSDFWFFTFGLFGFNGFDFLTIGDRDLDRLDFLRGEGVLDPYLRYVSGLILRDLNRVEIIKGNILSGLGFLGFSSHFRSKWVFSLRTIIYGP